MKEKIQLLIKEERLTQSRLAEILEIQPANISHILSGRSKPGFELLQRILRRFPRINPDWLLLDAEPMYRPGMESPSNGLTEPATHPDQERPLPNLDALFPSHPTPTTPATTSPVGMTHPASSPATPTSSAPLGSVPTLPTQPRGRVARVVLCYEDHTFECFDLKG